MLAALYADRIKHRSLLLFDVAGELRRGAFFPRMPGERGSVPARPPRRRRRPGRQPSELRIALNGYLHGAGAGRGHLSADLAERFGVSRTRAQDVLGNLRTSGLVRSERVRGSRKRLWYAI